MSFRNHRILNRTVLLTRMQQANRSFSAGTKLTDQFPRDSLNYKCNNLKKHLVTPIRNLNSQVLRPYVDPKLSYAFGRSEECLVHSTVAKEFDKQISRCPDELAFASFAEDISRTFAEFNRDVNKVAKALVQKFGLTKGDTVGLYAYNCYNWIVIEYACAKIGAILSPINPSYKAHELAYVLKKGRVKCLFMPGPGSVQSELNNHTSVLLSREVLDLSNNKDELKLRDVILMDTDKEYDLDKIFGSKLKQIKFHNWSSTQANDGTIFRSEQEADQAGVQLDNACIMSPDLVSPDDIFAIYYTSGTTGRPKGACISHFTTINNVRLTQSRLRQGRPANWSFTVATTLPLFHIFAGILTALSPAVTNNKVIFTSHKYDVKAFVDAIIKYKANTTSLTPTILIDLLTYIEQNNLSNDITLRTIQPGGSALPPELVARAFKILPQLEELRPGYGSTENGGVATIQTIYEPESSRASTVGPPLDFTEIRVVKKSADDNKSGASDLEECVPLGERGEIQTRGYNTMVGYLDDPDKSNEVITKNRWYKTGDIGTMLPHGSINITGRSKHMIIKGGENIYPEEVEQMMHEMEGIEKVHVVGVPDERFGEQVCAWIKLKPDYKELKGDYSEIKASKNRDPKAIHKEDVLKFCRDNITYFKVPKYLLFVDDFPMTPTKKVQGHIMLEESVKVLGLKKS